MKHKFITKAKKNSYLVDMIERYKKWKEAGGKDEDDSEGSDEEEKSSRCAGDLNRERER